MKIHWGCSAVLPPLHNHWLLFFLLDENWHGYGSQHFICWSLKTWYGKNSIGNPGGLSTPEGPFVHSLPQFHQLKMQPTSQRYCAKQLVPAPTSSYPSHSITWRSVFKNISFNVFYSFFFFFPHSKNIYLTPVESLSIHKTYFLYFLSQCKKSFEVTTSCCPVQRCLHVALFCTESNPRVEWEFGSQEIWDQVQIC